MTRAGRKKDANFYLANTVVFTVQEIIFPSSFYVIRDKIPDLQLWPWLPTLLNNVADPHHDGNPDPAFFTLMWSLLYCIRRSDFSLWCGSGSVFFTLIWIRMRTRILLHIKVMQISTQRHTDPPWLHFDLFSSKILTLVRTRINYWTLCWTGYCFSQWCDFQSGFPKYVNPCRFRSATLLYQKIFMNRARLKREQQKKFITVLLMFLIWAPVGSRSISVNLQGSKSV